MNKQVPDMEVYTVKQGDLTSDCLLVQIIGLQECARCKAFLKPNCGGGKHLINLIGNMLGDGKFSISRIEQHMCAQYVTGEAISSIQKEKKDLPPNSPVHKLFERTYYLKKAFKKLVEKERAKIEMESAPTQPVTYEEVINSEEWKTLSRFGHHAIGVQSGWAPPCDCKPITAKGHAYRYHILQNTNGEVAHFLHQNLIAMDRGDNGIQVWSCGWRTMATSSALNAILGKVNASCSGAKNLTVWDGPKYEIPIKFREGMIICKDKIVWPSGVVTKRKSCPKTKSK